MFEKSLSSRCQQVIEDRSLLRHPFYVAWSEGRLPVAALRDYARDYGAFIRVVGEGWARIGEARIAKVEDGHATVWQRTFAAGLGTSIAEPETRGVADLVETSRRLFADETSALGALYAFESQQPHTARSKLAGLREHYRELPETVGEYFRLHETDFDEPALLASRIDGLDEAGGKQALEACEQTAGALLGALTAIYAPHAAGCGASSETRRR
jgi:pyrroloquinoline-quinone synthase